MKDLFNKIIKNDQAMSLIRIISVATLLHMYKSSGHNTIEHHHLGARLLPPQRQPHPPTAGGAVLYGPHGQGD